MSPKHVIVIVDDDAALCGLLQGLLASEDRVVDVIDQVVGVTAELIALSQPTLVILNPSVGNLPAAVLKTVVQEVHGLTGARFVLLVRDEHAADAERLATEVGAHGALPVRTLLSSPLQALSIEALPVEPAPAPELNMGTLGVDDILSLEFDAQAPRAPPMSTPSQLARTPAPVAALEALITDELSRASWDSGIRSTRFDVVLDVTSDANLVAAHSGELFAVYVPTMFPPPVGARTRVQVDFPWGERLELPGTVAFEDSGSPFRAKRKPGVGIKVDTDEAFAKAAGRFAGLRSPMKHAA